MMRSLHRLAHGRCVSDDSGVGVLELVIASAILVGAAISILGALSFASTSGQQITARTKALDLASRAIERARNISYDGVGVVGGNPSGVLLAEDSTSAPGFVIMTQVTFQYDPTTLRPAYKNIKVTVTWSSPRAGSVSLASAIYGPTGVVNNGDLAVQVCVIGTTTPIQGAVVQVKASGSTSTTQSITTGVDGGAVFGWLPIGPANVSVSASGYVFAPVTPLPSVVPDVLTKLFVYGYQPCTVVARTVSAVATSTPVPYAAVTLTGAKGQIYSATTDANGYATITMMLPDAYGVAATKSGYADAAEALSTLAAGSSTPLEIEMSAAAPATAFKVRVINASGSAVPVAVVTVKTSAGVNVSNSPQNTPSNGEVFFSGLATGSYNVGVTATGYTAYPATAYSVVGGTDQTLEVVLTSTSTSAKGSLSIQVWTQDGEGHPDTGHKVTVYMKSGTQWVLVKSGSSDHFHTNSAGVVLINNLAVGTYRVTPENVTSQEDPVEADATTYMIFSTH
jgi:hypothetical protein